MEGRAWMMVAVSKGAVLRGSMKLGKAYLHEMFTTTFVEFETLDKAKEFLTWAKENIDHWGYDPVALIDTSDPVDCEKWKQHIEPERDSIAKRMIAHAETGATIFLPSSVEFSGGSPEKWWLCSVGSA